MTLEELKSFKEFANLPHYDGNDMTVTVPKCEPGSSQNSAMTTADANECLSKGAVPTHVEKHTSDDGMVGYEVVFCRAN